MTRLTIERASIADSEVSGLSDEQWSALYASPYCYAGKDGEKTVFLCGVMAMATGVGEVWLKIVDYGYIDTYRCVKNLLWDMIETGRFHRIQATTYVDETEIGFEKKLGFTPEGILRKYGSDKKDRIMWSIVR